MDYEELHEALQSFFGDTSRSASETREGLLDIIAEAETLVESLSDDIDD